MYFAKRNFGFVTVVAIFFPRGLGSTVEKVTFTLTQHGASSWISTNLVSLLADEAAVAATGLATRLATSTTLGALPFEISNLATNHALAILCGNAPVIVATFLAIFSARTSVAA